MIIFLGIFDKVAGPLNFTVLDKPYDIVKPMSETHVNFATHEIIVNTLWYTIKWC